MKFLTALLVLSFCHTLQADELEAEMAFTNRVYTPELVVDHRNHGAKGAVQLLWQKSGELTRYEVEVSNGLTTYSSVHERHFHHIMLYFNKDYRWRVREVSARRTTHFTPWMPIKVVKGDHPDSMNWQREAASAHHHEDEYMLDTGAQNP